MRTARGNHLSPVRQHERLFVLLLLGAAALPTAFANLIPTAGAEPLVPLFGNTTHTSDAPATLQLAEGDPVPLSPADGAHTRQTVLTWQPTGASEVQDTYAVRISTAGTIDETTGELTVVDHEFKDITEAQIDAAALTDATYWWQVRACRTANACGAWSQAWLLTIDRAAPSPPRAEVRSDPYDATPMFGGSAEPGSSISVRVGDTTCADTAGNDGLWSCRFDDKLDYGNHAAYVTATDTAGNVSQAYRMDIIVNERFVSPVITQNELAAVLSVIPIVPILENKASRHPPASGLYAAEPGTVTTATDIVRSKPFSAEGGIIRSSESGWQVAGMPWYVWLSGMASMVSGWWAMGWPTLGRLRALLA